MENNSIFEEQQRLIKVRLCCIVLLCIFNIIVVFGGLYYITENNNFYYTDEEGNRYHQLSAETPEYITVVDKNGEMADVVNKDKIKFVTNIRGEHVSVTLQRELVIPGTHIGIICVILLFCNLLVISWIVRMKKVIQLYELKISEGYSSIV